MNIHVRFLSYSSKTFTYAVPEELQDAITPGVLVQVPLKQRIVPAVVESIAVEDCLYKFEIKPILSVFPFPDDSCYFLFISKVAQYYQVDQLFLQRRLQSFLIEQRNQEICYAAVLEELEKPEIIFTQEQQKVLDIIMPAVQHAKHDVFVLHGVTGSGKTEVYKELVKEALAQNKAVMILFPEVTLALRFENIFSKSFPEIPVIGFHSASTPKQKKMMWQLLLEKKPVIIIGVHLPVLLPISHLGLIIVDEEHDHGYQEKKHPKINSKDMAILKASLAGIPIVLGSATPSLQALWNIENRGWKFLQMKQRFKGKFPSVKVVSLQRNVKRKYGWIHNDLYHAIVDRLEKREQTIIFLNRRGYSFFVQCSCSFVFSCHQCSVSLTLHQNNFLMCHYCGYKELLPQRCPSCKQYENEFIKKGIGTQQVVAMLEKFFPNARIERADLDTTSKKRSWANTVEDMYIGNIDILVGTQSITKGYHFPGVTLVGVLWADLNLHFPIYNASENTLQQLIQVSGRAGRQSNESLVIIQAFDQHPIFNFIDETNYLNFYGYEIENRESLRYPPCSHIAEVEFRCEDESLLNQEGAIILELCKKIVLQQGFKVDILGPVSSLVHKVKKIYFKKLILKSSSRHQLMTVFWQIRQAKLKSFLAFTMDPIA
ncbi:primosomal protein N' [Candidatus Dependentiae bacterium]|nr:primosomal protein N' [Candidatus Dependentiae bacterium]